VFVPPTPFQASQAALDACDAEPIHLPGGVQPFGVLLVLPPDGWRVVQASANAEELLGVAVPQLLGRALEDVFEPESLAPLVDGLEGLPEGSPVTLAPRLRGCGVVLEAVAHRHDGLLLFECHTAAAGAHEVDAREAVRELAALTRGGTLPSVVDFAGHLARLVRRVSGYDRVMVYRFDGAGNGEIVAEARDVAVEPFLGLHYPASDIPSQARALYLKKRVRLLGDVQAADVPLVPRTSPVTGREVDLSHAMLRAFSPVHREYLQTMGVRASLVLSVVREGRLWGLVACHHNTPRWLGVRTLEACDTLCNLLEVHLALHENVERARAEARVHQATHLLRRAVAVASDWPQALVSGDISLLDVVPAQGAAVVRAGEVWCTGTTPDRARVVEIADWLAGAAPVRLLALDALGAREERFAPIAAHASGLLAAEVSREEGSWLLWFRPEWQHTVRWGGAPQKHEELVDGVPRLSPRRSFAVWLEDVRGRAHPWTEGDLTAAELLRSALVDELLHLLYYKHLVLTQDLVRVRNAVQSSSEPMSICDVDGRTLFVNRAFRALFGLTEDDVRAGRAFGLFAPPCEDTGAPARLRSALQRDGGGALAPGGTWREELWMRGSGDDRLPIVLAVDTVLDDAGQHLGFVAAYRDLRAQYRADEQRRALEARMVQAQKLESLGILAGGIAHDFNNLLTGILGNVSLARMELADTEGEHGAADASLEQVELASRRAAELCQQMLAYAGKGQLVMQPLRLGALITEMRSLLGTVLSKHAVLRLELSPTLPPVKGDATQLRQVLMNLLTNASDSLGERPGSIIVRTCVRELSAAEIAGFVGTSPLAPGPWVELQVQDSGCGMDGATLARIFEPFFTTKFTGRGLGLAAALGIVGSHQGGLRVESQLGRGTTFTLLLPPTAEALPRAVGNVPWLQGRASGLTVLVVDDDAGVRAVARRILEHAGFTVLMASDGLEGLALFRARAQAVDLVVLDLVMPGMGGVEVLAELRALRPEVRVLLASGYNEEDAIGQSTGDALTGFIKKPYQATELMRRAVRMLEAQEAPAVALARSAE